MSGNIIDPSKNILKGLNASTTVSPLPLSCQPMDLKGQMIFVSESNAVLFLGSPCVDKLEELTGRGLYLSDIPIHNALRDVVLVGEQAKAQDGLKKRLGKAKTALEHAHQALEEEKKRTVDLLFTIFPGTVAQELWQGHTVQAKKFDRVTMLFSDIVGFTAVCSRCTPMQVVTMLNELYTRFDHQCGELDVYKVRPPAKLNQATAMMNLNAWSDNSVIFFSNVEMYSSKCIHFQMNLSLITCRLIYLINW